MTMANDQSIAMDGAIKAPGSIGSPARATSVRGFLQASSMIGTSAREHDPAAFPWSEKVFSVMDALDASLAAVRRDRARHASGYLRDILNEAGMPKGLPQPAAGKYERNIVYQGKYCRGIVITWGSGARSPDHSHNVECVFGIPSRGRSLHEIVYERDRAGNRMKEIRARDLLQRDMSVEEIGYGISHVVLNRHRAIAQSFHIYLAPPGFQDINQIWH